MRAAPHRRSVDAVTAGRRVVIAEDSVLLLAGLTKLLESAGFEVAATAADAAGLLAAVEREQPDVVIADVRMPPTHTDEGIKAALVIRSQWPDIAVLVLSQYVEERYAADLLSANTHGIGYLLKDRVADVAEFLDALRRTARWAVTRAVSRHSGTACTGLLRHGCLVHAVTATWLGQPVWTGGKIASAWIAAPDSGSSGSR